MLFSALSRALSASADLPTRTGYGTGCRFCFFVAFVPVCNNSPNPICFSIGILYHIKSVFRLTSASFRLLSSGTPWQYLGIACGSADKILFVCPFPKKPPRKYIRIQHEYLFIVSLNTLYQAQMQKMQRTKCFFSCSLLLSANIRVQFYQFQAVLH